MSAEVNNCP